MKRVLALGLVAAGALASRDANANAAVLFTAGGDAHVDRHNITVTLGTQGTVTWDSIDISGNANDIGLVVAVKAGGRVEITEPAFASAIDLATRVVVKQLPSGVTCKSVGVGVGVDFDAGASVPPVTVNGSSGGGGGGGCSGDESSSSKGEATGGCLSSSQGGCGSCDDNGGGCDPSEHGHPGCSALHGCAPKGESGDDDDATTPPRDAGGSAATIGPYEETRIQSSDGSAVRWLDRYGYQAPPGFLDGLLALEADGYQVHAFRARAPAAPSIVKSLRVVTTSPSPTVPLRLVRMSTGANISATPVTLITLAGGAQALVAQPMVTIDETKLASQGGNDSNYETLVGAALGAPTTDAGDAGATETRWLAETSRTVSATTTDGGASTLGDYFRDACGAPKSEPHLVCDSDFVTDAGRPDAEADADAPDASDDAGTAELDAGCTEVPRERCDDLALALPAGVNVASRFRGVVAGEPARVSDLAFGVSSAPLRDGRFTVRPTGEPGLCAPVAEERVGGDVSASGDAAASCKAVRKSRFRVDLGPLVTVLVVIRVLTAVMRRGRRRS